MNRQKLTTHNDASYAEERSTSIVGLTDSPLLYASDVRVVVDPGGVQLIFTRFLPPLLDAEKAEQSNEPKQYVDEVIARVELPPLAARRLLRLLPGQLDNQRELANDYARATDRAADTSRPRESDPFLDVLAAAEYDDEPYTDEQREAVAAGWEAYQHGETAPWEEVRRELLELEEDDVSPASIS